MTTGRVPARSRLARARYTIECLGWRRALHEMATGRWPYEPERDTSFDDAHGTTTSRAVPTDELGIADPERRGQAIRYLPSPERVTNWMLDRAEVDTTATTFVDIGCGKGRVLLLAARRPFRRVVGVEISPELAEIARSNASGYEPAGELRAEVEIRNEDATTFEFPSTDLLVHLYHPFEPPVLRGVLRQLDDAARRQERRVTVAYLAYTQAVEGVDAAFAELPWLRLTRYEQTLRGHYNWLLYAN